MARYIYKYAVRIGSEAQILLDENADILSMGIQYDVQWLDDVAVFWAYCEDGKSTRPRTFRVIGTGWEVPAGAVHRGTAQHDGEVWHLMELPT